VSLNLGTDAINACMNLSNSADFILFRDGLLERARDHMNQALDIEPTKRDDAIGYARALRDLWIAIEAAATGQRIQQIKKPNPIQPGAVAGAGAR
jgi:hypothetical protein